MVKHCISYQCIKVFGRPLFNFVRLADVFIATLFLYCNFLKYPVYLQFFLMATITIFLEKGSKHMCAYAHAFIRELRQNRTQNHFSAEDFISCRNQEAASCRNRMPLCFFRLTSALSLQDYILSNRQLAGVVLSNRATDGASAVY
jgi:hypothetical protein